ncbi:MAG: 50S ribosomal protein L29 [Rhodospirillaceae bacterium]|nr:50S ribosomal protein L29 [Rhodospirillaceae bacterium]|tara:strand:- start:13693 stop:13896 length:204 start_codon:yes stop_codon:yes gene_type:complete
MDAADIRTKTDDELTDQLQELKKEALNLRFQRASGQLEATARIRQVRRDIARVRTVMGERRQAAVQG